MKNPLIHPNITDAMRATVAQKTAAATELLKQAAAEFQPIGFASSMGAEDMVLTDLIQRNALEIEIFTLDTGRLPAETYDLMAKAEQHYGARPVTFFPRHEAVEEYVRKHGINAFYDSVDLRKACCAMRKVEPLKRALAGKKAWITGMRAQQSATRSALPTREFDEGHGIEKFNPLSDWTEREVWVYIHTHEVPYNELHERFFPSIGCQPCTRAISPGEDIRAGRWWWENPESKECGLHVKAG
ncbi:phosphoadenylyl-sulfate reductase [Methyloversatilis sp. NSM2]|uniref:phosphoadenylyl-sulfate reductase n=1 Tax=Methyloversatilis sp. NSM2 TaxID=3134135 RepID=UPI00311813C0